MRGSKRKLRAGVWELRVSLGKDPATGKYRQISKTFHGPARAADDALRDLVDKYGDAQEDGFGATFGQLLDRWLEECERMDLSPTTLRTYRAQIKQTIRPRLGKVVTLASRTIGRGRRMDHFPGGRIGLVGCVKEKAAVALPARQLYTSTLFRGRARYVARSCDRWFILSALHGLVEPDAVLQPYDQSLDGASRQYRREWSQRVLGQLRDALGNLGDYEYEIHAGAPYRDFGLTDGLKAAGATFTNPTAGLRFGNQLAFYSQANR